MNSLATQRCRNHAHREAAVRCPGCRQFFCRECTGEHDGRLLCAQCLSAAVHSQPLKLSRWGWLSIGLSWAVGLAVSWTMFGLLGRVLTEIPDDLHEGTYWQFLVDDPP